MVASRERSCPSMAISSIRRPKASARSSVSASEAGGGFSPSSRRRAAMRSCHSATAGRKRKARSNVPMRRFSPGMKPSSPASPAIVRGHRRVRPAGVSPAARRPFALPLPQTPAGTPRPRAAWAHRARDRRARTDHHAAATGMSRPPSRASTVTRENRGPAPA